MHVKEAHSCAAGGECTSLQDPDVEMDGMGPGAGAGSSAVFCRECVLVLKQPGVFCSAGCYGANFQRHRDDVHLPERERRRMEREGRGSRGGSREAEGDAEMQRLKLAGDEDGAQHQPPRKIEEHLITLEDAIQEYRQTSGAAITS